MFPEKQNSTTAVSGICKYLLQEQKLRETYFTEFREFFAPEEKQLRTSEVAIEL